VQVVFEGFASFIWGSVFFSVRVHCVPWMNLSNFITRTNQNIKVRKVFIFCYIILRYTFQKVWEIGNLHDVLIKDRLREKERMLGAVYVKRPYVDIYRYGGRRHGIMQAQPPRRTCSFWICFQSLSKMLTASIFHILQEDTGSWHRRVFRFFPPPHNFRAKIFVKIRMNTPLPDFILPNCLPYMAAVLPRQLMLRYFFLRM
jgi:hypothetical protein